jgi:hypothetical protein
MAKLRVRVPDLPDLPDLLDLLVLLDFPVLLLPPARVLDVSNEPSPGYGHRQPRLTVSCAVVFTTVKVPPLLLLLLLLPPLPFPPSLARSGRSRSRASSDLVVEVIMLRVGRLLSSCESSRPNVAPNAFSNGFILVALSLASPRLVAAK